LEDPYPKIIEVSILYMVGIMNLVNTKLNSKATRLLRS
jgi:hypothetical protein